MTLHNSQIEQCSEICSWEDVDTSVLELHDISIYDLVGVIRRSVSTVRIQYIVSLLCGWWLFGVRSQQVCLRCVRIFINTSQCHNASRIKWWGHVVTDGPRHLLYTKLTQPWCQMQLSPWHWYWIHYETMMTMIDRAIDYSLKKYWHASSDYPRPQPWICKYS